MNIEIYNFLDKNKAKAHLGFDLNRGIPRKLYLTEGKGGERPFVNCILESGQTGVVDRGYQDHSRFDEWIDEGKHFVARLKNNTRWEVLEKLPYDKNSNIFFFAKVKLGDENHRMQHPVYLVGFRVGKKTFWIATDRADLTPAEIAFIYSLRWEIEKLFSWWKRHLKVYHLISRNRHGMLLQLLSGLITYLLLVLYCYQLYGEKPSIRRLRELRRRIRKETGYAVYVMNIQINIQVIALLLLFSIHAIF
jgi:IS4 transposase